MIVPGHEMVENQVMMTLSGHLSDPERLVSCRAGSVTYRPGSPDSQRCRSQPPSEERVREAWSLEREVRARLARFDAPDADVKLQILSRERVVRGDTEPVRSAFAAFWGHFQTPDGRRSVFGSDAKGALVFRRGPWEDWPTDPPRFQEVDPTVPIVLSPYCGTLFHEAVGHALEAEYLPQSPLKYRFGERITHPELVIADRPDLTGYAGSMQVDDVGRPASATTLIHRGHLVGDLAGDKGVWRRSSYRELPWVRASNFIIKAGTQNPEGWTQFQSRCYYITWIQTGNWRPGTHRIKILTGPIYLLEKGLVTAQRPWAQLELTTADLLDRVAGVGNDFAMDPAVHWCVKKNQSVPMAMGAPSILIRGAA